MLVPLTMTPMPKLLIVLLLGLCPSLAGCCRSPDVARPEAVTAGGAAGADESSAAAAAETTATTATAENDDPMGDRAKLKDLQEQWESKNYSYIIPDAQALLGRPDLEPTLRLQVCFLLAQAYSGAGETAKAAETMERYVKLREQLIQSEALQAQKAVRTSAQGIVSRLLEKHRGKPGVEVRQSEVLEARLKGVEAGTIVELEADSGGKIFCCSDAQALEAKLAGVRQGGEELVIQHDTEFDFYFAIQEEPPPVGGR